MLLIIAIIIVAGAFVVTQAMTANAPGAIATDGALISQIIAKVQTDDSVVTPIRLLEGGDAAHESAHIFDAIEMLPGLGVATLDTEKLTLAVTFDSGTTSADVIRRQLASAGYAPLTAADATPAEVAGDGSVQRISIADNGGFVPSLIKAKAGIPLELTFAPGTECRTSIILPELDVKQDISAGGVVSLPGLEPGTYRILCGGEGDEGSIIVE